MARLIRSLLAALALLVVCTPVDAHKSSLWKSWQKYQKKAYKVKRSFDDKMNKLSHDLFDGFPSFDFGHSAEKEKLCERYVNETRKELQAAHEKTKHRLAKAFDDITSYRQDLTEAKQAVKQCQNKLDSEQLNLMDARSKALQDQQEVDACRSRLRLANLQAAEGAQLQEQVESLTVQVATLQQELTEARRLQSSETCRSAGWDDLGNAGEDSYRKHWHNGHHHHRRHRHRHHGGFDHHESWEDVLKATGRHGSAGGRAHKCCFLRHLGAWALLGLIFFGLKKYTSCCRRRRTQSAGEQATEPATTEGDVTMAEGASADDVAPPATFEYDADEMSASNRSWQMVSHEVPSAAAAAATQTVGAVEGARITPDGGEGEVGPTLSDSFCQRTGASLKSMHIPCPGIDHSGVTIYAKPNSAQVLFQRSASEGWEAKTWTYSYVIPHSEGTFTFQDTGLHMPKLEHGFLKVNFAPSANPRSQVWNFPAHFYLDEDGLTEVASTGGEEELPLLTVPAEEAGQGDEGEEEKEEKEEKEDPSEQEQEVQQGHQELEEQDQQPQEAVAPAEVEAGSDEEEEPEQEQEHQPEQPAQSQTDHLQAFFRNLLQSQTSPPAPAPAPTQAESPVVEQGDQGVQHAEEEAEEEDAAADAMSVETDGRSDNSSEQAASELESDSNEEEDEEEDEEEEGEEAGEEDHQANGQGLEQSSECSATPRDVPEEESPRGEVVNRQGASISRASSLDDEYVVC